MIEWKSLKEDGLPTSRGYYLILRQWETEDGIPVTLVIEALYNKYANWDKKITHWAEINYPEGVRR